MTHPPLPWPGMPCSPRFTLLGSICQILLCFSSSMGASSLHTELICSPCYSVQSTGPGRWSPLLKNDQRDHSKVIAPMIMSQISYLYSLCRIASKMCSSSCFPLNLPCDQVFCIGKLFSWTASLWVPVESTLFVGLNGKGDEGTFWKCEMFLIEVWVTGVYTFSRDSLNCTFRFCVFHCM